VFCGDRAVSRGILGFDSPSSCARGLFPAGCDAARGTALADALEREFGEREKAKLTARLEPARA